MMLATHRLVLRPWRKEDAESLFFYAKDPAVGLPAGWPPHTDAENCLYVIEHVFSGRECYAICEKGADTPVGAVELKLNGHTDMTERDDECELGYWLGKPLWGRGYMPEAAEALLRRAFTELGMRTVWCGYYEGNVRSKRVQEKLGFEYDHTCDDVEVPLLGEVRVSHTNRMTRERWQLLYCPETPLHMETERLIITEFTPDMAQAVHENSLDEDTRRFLPDEVFETAEDARETIEFLMAQYASEDGPLVYPVLTKAGENIGYVELPPLEDGWEIGYHIGKKYTGRGYATEAVRAFLPVIAHRKGLREIRGICLAENAASVRVLEKCGFTVGYRGTGTYRGEQREIVRAVWSI